MKERRKIEKEIKENKDESNKEENVINKNEKRRKKGKR